MDRCVHRHVRNGPSSSQSRLRRRLRRDNSKKRCALTPVGLGRPGPAWARAMSVCRSGAGFPPPTSACTAGGSPRPEVPTLARCPVVPTARGAREDVVANARAALGHLLGVDQGAGTVPRINPACAVDSTAYARCPCRAAAAAAAAAGAQLPPPPPPAPSCRRARRSTGRSRHRPRRAASPASPPGSHPAAPCDQSSTAEPESCIPNYSDISLSYQRRFKDCRRKVTRHA
jgi:hypothetical protein